jgi:hypothetical protein
MLKVQPHTLKHNAFIAGSKAGPKMHIKPGTTIFVVKWEGKYFWSGYLSKAEAEATKTNLLDGMSRDTPEMKIAVLNANFNSTPPISIKRPAK